MSLNACKPLAPPPPREDQVPGLAPAGRLPAPLRERAAALPEQKARPGPGTAPRGGGRARVAGARGTIRTLRPPARPARRRAPSRCCMPGNGVIRNSTSASRPTPGPERSAKKSSKRRERAGGRPRHEQSRADLSPYARRRARFDAAARPSAPVWQTRGRPRLSQTYTIRYYRPRDPSAAALAEHVSLGLGERPKWPRFPGARILLPPCRAPYIDRRPSPTTLSPPAPVPRGVSRVGAVGAPNQNGVASLAGALCRDAYEGSHQHHAAGGGPA
jgi:hypothetical protein